MIAITEHQPVRTGIARGELGAAEYIPYASHYDDQTILTKNGQLIQFIKLNGFSFESADAGDIDLKKRLRNVLFKSIARHDYALWFHTIRRRQPTYPEGAFEPGFAKSLNDHWRTKSHGRQLFENNLYVSIVRRGFSGKIPGFGGILKSLSQEQDRQAKKIYLESACQDLTDITRRLVSALTDYGPHVLSMNKAGIVPISEPLSFLARLINLEERPVLAPTMDLSRYLSYKRLFFGQDALECRGSTGSLYAAMMSVKEYSSETTAGMLDGLFHLPFEFVITQSFVFSHRQQAIQQMQLQQRRMEQAEDLSVSQIEEIDQALDDAVAGTIAFGDHHLTIQPIVRDLKELNDALARIDTELMNVGILGVREDLNMEPCFWSQLPGNFEHIARRSTISTANLAGFASLHNYPSGRPADNHWGPAVTVLETQSGTPYFFNFHAGDVGHTLVIGPTGSGKTALVNFLCAQARKFQGRLIYFDRDRGAEIFLRALGGTYSILGGGHKTGFNPLQLPDTPQNRAFLIEWLASLLTVAEGTFSSEDLARATEAIAGCYKLPREKRTLANLTAFFGMAGEGSPASRLSAWHGQGARAAFFGGVEDVFSLDQAVHGFEMGPLMNDPKALAPVLLYLFHRIASILDGTPTMIVIEEAWALFRNPVFASKIEDWLKTFRKMNAFLVFSTQSVEDAIRSPISPTLVSQTVTHLYFPNSKATDDYRTVFKLSDRELHLVREILDKESRYFLLKQGRDSVVARIDLSGMSGFLNVLSGRAETVLELDRLRTERGDTPAAWLPTLMEESHVSKN